MGHASSIALSIALEQKDRRVVCLDGDAAAIMHMGALTMVSKIHCPNFLHVLPEQRAHESVGGQPSVGHLIDFFKDSGSLWLSNYWEACIQQRRVDSGFKCIAGCR